MPTPPPLTGLPTSAYITARLGGTGVSPQTEALYDSIVPLVLSEIGSRCEIPLPAVTITDEQVYCSGALPRIVPAFWPITAVSAVKLPGTTVLKVGTPFQLASGTSGVSVAIDPTMKYLVTNCALRGPVFVSYTAGYNALPYDLLEVFFEWALLVGKEKERAGLSNVEVDQLKIQTFVRKLPDWALRTIHHYDRMTAYL